jgi:high affinity sulfate transporter 1
MNGSNRDEGPTGVLRWLPGVQALRTYPRAWLPRDLIASLVLTAFVVPVGMGYAQAAGLPPITGLYATIVPLAAYALVGPSRVMVMGPDSSLAAVIAAIVLPLAAGSQERAIAFAGMLAIIAGVVIATAGLGRLGFVTELLSRPVQFGYLAGIALTIVVGQLPKLFGFSVVADGLPNELWAFLTAVPSLTNWPSVALGVGAILVILTMRRVMPWAPGTLMAVVLGIAATVAFDLREAGVEVLGLLPQGLPSFAIPDVSWSSMTELFVGALGISLVAVADTTVLSQSLAARRGERVEPNQELFALGTANVAAGLFGGFAISSSASRTPVAIAAGAKSQVTNLVAAVAVALLIVIAPALLRNLPQPVLAGIVIVAAFGLIELAPLRRLLRSRRSEFTLFVAAFLGVALLGVLAGIFLAIVLSLGDFVRRAWRPHDAVLGRVESMKGYHDLERFPDARRIPGLLLYRFDAPLFFANAEYFRRQVLDHALAAEPETSWVVIAAEPITDIDTTAAETLRGLLEELREMEVTLAFAELKDPVKDRLRRYGPFDRIGEDRFFPTLGTAVDAYLESEDVEWVDWEEEDDTGITPPSPDPPRP